MDDRIIYLYNEDGTEFPFELVDSISYEGVDYAVLMALEPSDGEADIEIMQIEEIPDSCEISLVTPEDDSVAEKVFKMFVETHPYEYDYPTE